ncbi:hypothetical protein [uncultured Vibrio sp.]|uniref:lipopolysaccharide biosynthesis protein n=1 Tax=uncultured Vibrio sp. TaxID=114054 RepID=UPI002AA6C00E|nr:hypothetical protein [uncultured Vibrio sp.]
MFLKNAKYKFAVYVINIVVIIITTPYIINGFGVEIYGLITSINVSLDYIAIFVTALSIILGRSLIYSKSTAEVNEKISEVYITYSLIVTISMFVFSIFLYNTNYDKEIIIFLVITIISFFIRMFMSVYRAIFFSKNMLYMSSVSDFIYKSVFYSIIAISIHFYNIGLIYYSLMLLCLTGVVLFIFNRAVSEIGFKWNIVKPRLKNIYEMLKSSSWMVLNQLGAMLYFSLGIILLNKYQTLKVVGLYSISLLIITQIKNISSLVNNLFEPKILEYFKEGNLEDAYNCYLGSMLISGIVLSIISGTLFLNLSDFYALWIGEFDQDLVILTQLMLVHLPLSATSAGIWILALGLKKDKYSGLSTLIFGFINIILILAIETFNIQYEIQYSYIIICTITMFMKNNIFMPYILRGNKFSILRFYTYLLMTIVIAAVTIYTNKIISDLILVNTVTDFILRLTAATTLNLLLVVVIILPFVKYQDFKKLIG